MVELLQSMEIQASPDTPQGATVTFALVGPTTRFSKAVDSQIEAALKGTSEQAPTALVAIILPEHEDYSAPFYEPENISPRIHDQVSRESAVLRKWSKKKSAIAEWIEEALRRRVRFPAPSFSFSTLSELKSFAWNDSSEGSTRSPWES